MSEALPVMVRTAEAITPGETLPVFAGVGSGAVPAVVIEDA